MEFNKDLDTIAAKQAEAYGRAKAETEVNAMSTIATDTSKTLQTKLNSKLAEHIDNDKNVLEKVEETANKLVVKGLKTQENKVDASVINSEDEILTADYEKNKNEYLYHGINHKIDRKWKRQLVLFINDIRFVIRALISFFTIVPVSTFIARIGALKGFIKGFALTIGILLLLGILAAITYFIVKRSGLIG